MSLIKCEQCGEQLPVHSNFCPRCGSAISADSSDLFSRNEIPVKEILSQKNLNPEEISGEEILIDRSLASFLKSAINVDSGFAYLTNYRIAFCGVTAGLVKLLASPVLFAMTTNKDYPRITVQILLKDIVSIEEKKHGFSKKYIFTLVDGKNLTFQLSDVDSWRDILTKHGIQWG